MIARSAQLDFADAQPVHEMPQVGVVRPAISDSRGSNGIFIHLRA